jgi:predicted RNA-binding Zn-ribbon protein involved in translation (DUF1610 family)
MEPENTIYDQGTFDKKSIDCPKCGWHGTGRQANVADFYGIGKFQQVSCPKCGEYLGNLSRNRSFGEGGSPRDADKGPR